MPEAPQDKLRIAPDVPEETFAASDVPYAELDVTTNFTFLQGASHPDELVLQAARLGYRAIAVTDTNTLAGVVRMHDAVKQIAKTGTKWAPKLLIGARLVFTDAPDILVWAPHRPAYARLCRLLTLGRRRAEKGECTLHLEDFLSNNEGLLAAVVPGMPFMPTANVMPKLKDALGAERLSVLMSRAFGGDDETRVRNIANLARRFGVPLLATNAVHYHDPSRRPLQDVLTCIRHGCNIREAGFKLFPNAERYLKPPERMHRLFAEFPHAIRRGLEIAERCTFSLDELRYEYPREIVPDGCTPAQYLANLTWAGAAERYPDGIPEKVHNLLIAELDFIQRLNFEPYFLTVHDAVRFARERGILCQGRGSAANSAVCYCLGVTSVDPAKIDVLFERFLSSARGEPPDIDIDFEHERREEVIQYIYEKYGRERAGMTATVITYRGRSAVRDVGKALGLGLDVVDQLAKRLDWWHRGTLNADQLRESGVDPNDPTVRALVGLTAQLLGFPRHLSQHTGGMVMTRGPLCEMVPIENASMEDRTVIEWDKDDIDALGILKVDVLALGMLTVISKAFKMLETHTPSPRYSGGNRAAVGGRVGERGSVRVEEMEQSTVQTDREVVASGLQTSLAPLPCPSTNRCAVTSGVPGRGSKRYEIATLPDEDPAVYDMISDADTIGVFQVESRAQMSMLPRLRPEKFYDLVIEVAIVRPGPIQGNMVHPYLQRRELVRQGRGDEIVYESEDLKNVLSHTLGVSLFQEQAMRVVMVAAGFSAEDADKLRRAMASWRKNGVIDTFYPKIISGMLERGYTREFAERVFEQIRGFGEYGFPESHAASFAILVYASAWIKRHHPAVFCAALLNSQPMGFYAPAQIVRDAIDHGVEVRHVDVNESAWDCTLENLTPSSLYSGERGERRSDARSGDVSHRVNESTATSLHAHPTSLPHPLPGVPGRGSEKHTWGHGGPAVRLGFRRFKGMREDHANILLDVRRHCGRFESIDQLHRMTELPVSVMRRLAEADAFSSLGFSRRQALWQVMALSDEKLPLFELDCMPIQNPQSEIQNLPEMSLGQEVMTDYATGGLSLKTHPVALVRPQLDQLRIITAKQLHDLDRGWVKVAGLVLIRQRPGTASGIVFETLEDETGIVNLIIRPDIYEKYRPAARHAALVQADGYVERQGKVIHIMAKRLFDLSHLLHGLSHSSRDFH